MAAKYRVNLCGFKTAVTGSTLFLCALVGGPVLIAVGGFALYLQLATISHYAGVGLLASAGLLLLVMGSMQFEFKGGDTFVLGLPAAVRHAASYGLQVLSIYYYLTQKEYGSVAFLVGVMAILAGLRLVKFVHNRA